MNAADHYPEFRSGNLKWYPQNVISPLVPVETGNIWFVDGDKTTGGGGRTWEDAFGESDFNGNLSALNIAAGDVIYVAGRTMAATDTDPISYTTNLVVNVPQVSIIGVSRGRTQGGLPQLKVGATTTSPIISVRAPGVLIQNLGINGAGGTGGGIVLDDDGGTTKAAFGASILGCHFKNCVGTTATDATTGGAIKLAGAPWQILIAGNRFYKNVGDILSVSTYSDFQDVVIEDNIFSGQAANTDCNIYMVAGGAGNLGLIIKDNIFPQLPNISSGANKRYMILTGCTGMIVGNTFGCLVTDTGTTLTFLASTGTAAVVPTTMHMANNWGESAVTTEIGYVGRGTNT